MAKTKKRRKLTVDKASNIRKSKNAKKSLNPFEIHINKQKMKVLGRNSLYEKGFPGFSRAKAITKRKKTLLQEYKSQNKSNKFVDRRIGEQDFNFSKEDRTSARFVAAERVKRGVKVLNKRSIFSLDDGILEHKGQTLNEIEKFETPQSDDDYSDGENETGRLESDFVATAHFGNGILKDTNKEGAKTHKELIEQIIAESKKRKAEKQITKEQTLQMTEKLDSEWKDLIPLVNKLKKSKDDNVMKPSVDNYDKIMRELKFEARGIPSDRLKTEDEIAKEEKEKLEKLESERLERMKGNLSENVSKQTHRSADDLDDDFVYESDTDNILSYNEQGESNIVVNAQINGRDIREKNEVSGMDSGSEDDESDNESESDNLSDLKESDISSDDEVEKVQIEPRETNHIRDDLRKRQEIMQQARNELPYTFSLPLTYEDLEKTFENQSSCHQSVIIERMIKCNHPSLGESNKDGLQLLFIYLLQYIFDISEDACDEASIKMCFEKANSLFPQLFDLAQLNKDKAHNSVLEVIKEKQGDWRKRPGRYPELSILIYLKLVSCLFSTSDFRHQIVTPSFIFMEQILNKCKVKNRRDISYGLFVTTLLLEYTLLSRRYLSATINFLSGILHMAIPKIGIQLLKVLPPFKSNSSLLVLENVCSVNVENNKLDATDLLESEIDDSFKIRAIYTAIKLLTEFFEQLKTLPSVVEIFEPTMKYLKLFPKDMYPEDVKNVYERFFGTYENFVSNRTIEYVALAKKKPKALRLYEPKIEVVYDFKKHKVQSKVKAERDKLLHKIKKEKKGALREIRKDKAFLGRIKINQKLQSDAERKEKVKRIFSEAASQQSELNALDRKKKKKK